MAKNNTTYANTAKPSTVYGAEYYLSGTTFYDNPAYTYDDIEITYDGAMKTFKPQVQYQAVTKQETVYA